MLQKKIEQFQNLIKNATIQILPFPALKNQATQPINLYQSDLILPSTYPFKSTNQIESGIQTNHLIIHTKSTLNMSSLLENKWPLSCIGLILCEHHQNNKIYYVYGTGTLIHNSIVLTSAQNVYCRRFHKEYENIRFITGVNGNKCSGIYDVMKVHYPKEYNKQEGYQQYDFAVLQLYDDLSVNYGSIGLKTDQNTNYNDELSFYVYMSGKKQGQFILRQIASLKIFEQHEKRYSGSGRLVKEENSYYITGLYLQSTKSYKILSEQIKNIINEWTKSIKLKIEYQDLSESCDEIVKQTTTDLRQLFITYSNINAQGCKYLSQANWLNLIKLDLRANKIGAEGCKHLSQANWIHLTTIKLSSNNIGAQGCKYLIQTNWRHLNNMNLLNNNIGVQGCRYLRQANWPYLNGLQLGFNSIKNDINRIILKQLWQQIKF